MMDALAIATKRFIPYAQRSIILIFSIAISLVLMVRPVPAATGTTIALSAPTNGSVWLVGSDITISATATPAAGQTITKVDFYQGTTLITTDTTSPYSITWSAVPAGSYSLTAKALTNTGAITTSSARTITVATAPTVSLTAPINNANFVPGSTIVLSATAAVAGGQTIYKVSFYQGTTLISSDTSAPYTANWTKAAVGSYSLTAKATTNLGVVATSIPVAITVGAVPTISLSAPANAAVFGMGSNITVSANATATSQTITQVNFYQGTTLIGTDTTSPYSITWLAVPAGNYSLTAKVTTNLGLSTTSAARTITVAAAPTVILTSPVNNSVATPPANFTLSATTTAATGLTISKVDFYQGTTLIATDTTSPYSVAWSAVPSGSYSLTAKATDSLGSMATSTAVVVTVNAPPTVELTAPSDHSNYYAPANITLTADATDSDGTIAQVNFYTNNTLLGNATTSPYSFNWSNVPIGNYSLTAKVTDNLGAVISSAPISVTVSIYNPLNINISSPAPGATINDDIVLVTGTFLQGVSNIGISVNGIVAAQYGNTFYALVPLQVGTNTLSISAKTITGGAFNQTLIVASSGPAPIQLKANMMSGVVPLTVNYTIQNNTGNAITLIEADFNGDGVGDFTTADPAAVLQYIYTTHGVYQANFKITDSQNTVVEKTFLVVAQDLAHIDQVQKAQWSNFTNALIAGDKQAAMAYMSDYAQLKYGPVLDVLMPDFPQILPTWSPLLISNISGAMAEYAVVTDDGIKRQLFLVYFILGEDGVWRLESM